MGKIKAILRKILFNKWLLYLENKQRYRKKVLFGYSVNIGRNSSFEGMNRIYSKTIFAGAMGYGSYINKQCEIFAQIGRFSSIAPYVKTNHGIHPYQYPFATTSPAFYSLVKQNGNTFATQQMFQELIYADSKNKIPVIIGSDCWIGQGVFIIGGVKMNDGGIVLAGAVVTKDVPPYAIVGGVPAKILKFRYDNETITFLLQTKWWNKDIKWLKENHHLLCNIDLLKEKLI